MAEDKGTESQSSMNDNLIRMKHIDDQLKALESQKQELSKKKETYLQSLKNVYPNFFTILKIYDGEIKDQTNDVRPINLKEYSQKIKIDDKLIKSVQKAQTEIHLKELQKKREQLFENKLKKLKNIGKLPKILSFESEASDLTASIKESSKLISKNLFSAESTSYTSPDEDDSKFCAFKSLSEVYKTKKDKDNDQNTNLPKQQIIFSQSSISTFKENPYWKKAIEESNHLEQLSTAEKADITKSKETHEQKSEQSNISKKQESLEVGKNSQTDRYIEPIPFSLNDQSDHDKEPKESPSQKNSKDTLKQAADVATLQDSLNFSPPYQSIPNQSYNYFYPTQNLANNQLQQALSYPLQTPNLPFVPPNFTAFNNSSFPPPFFNTQQNFPFLQNPYFQNPFVTPYADSSFGVPQTPLLFQNHPPKVSKTLPGFNSGRYSEEDILSETKKLINRTIQSTSNGTFRKKYRSQKECLLSQSSDDNYFRTYDSKKPQKSMTIFENSTVKCLFKLFELLENCQKNGQMNKKSKKITNTETWYRDATPSHTLKKDINATILTKGIKPDRVSYATLSMVALGHLKEIVARLPGSCLLEDNVISDHYRTFEELSKSLEKPKRELWDRVAEHMRFLLQKKVMTLKKLVSTFLLILLHPQSEKAVKAENMLIRLFRTGLTRKQVEESKMNSTHEISNEKEDSSFEEEKNKKDGNLDQKINSDVSGSKDSGTNKTNEKKEISQKTAVPNSSSTAAVTPENKADGKLNDEIIPVIISTCDKDANSLWEEDGYKEIYLSEDMSRFTSSEMTIEGNDEKNVQHNYNFNRPFFIDTPENNQLEESLPTSKINNKTGNLSKPSKYNDKLENENPNENNVNSNEANLNLQPRLSSSPVSSLKEFSPIKENHRYKTLVSSHSFPIESASSDDEIEKQYKNMTLTSSLATTGLNELKQTISSKDSLDTTTAYISSFSNYKIQNGSLKTPSTPPNTTNQTPMTLSIEKFPTMELTRDNTELGIEKNGRVAHTSVDINKLINNESEDDSW